MIRFDFRPEDGEGNVLEVKDCEEFGRASTTKSWVILNADGKLSDARFWIMIVVLAAAFLISMILYVLYYRMEPMKAFYAAMVPLITEGVSMVVLLVLTWA